jgi:hypothetical protein
MAAADMADRLSPLPRGYVRLRGVSRVDVRCACSEHRLKPALTDA